MYENYIYENAGIERSTMADWIIAVYGALEKLGYRISMAFRH